MKKAYITGATGAIGMALVGELLKNGISTTVFLRKDSGRNDHVKDSFSGELASGLLRIEYVSLEELSGYALSRNTQDMQTYASQDLLTKAAGGADTAVFYHLGWSGTFGEQRNDADMQHLQSALAVCIL